LARTETSVAQGFHMGVGGFCKGEDDGGRLLTKGMKNNGRSVLLVSEGLNGPLSSTAKGTKCHKIKRLDLFITIPGTYCVEVQQIYHCYAQTFDIPY
jgi:hypothetical protein